jgi:hypothetical protein
VWRAYGTPPGRIIASIEDPDVIQKILKHLGLDQVGYPRNRSPPSNLTDQQTTLFKNSSALITLRWRSHSGSVRIRGANHQVFNRLAQIFDHTTHIQMG